MERRRLYCFDFDDTLVTTDARIWTVDGPMSTREYAAKKKELFSDNPFREFDDVDSCKITPVAFYDVFIQALRNESPIAIITARDNNPIDFKRLVSRAAALSGGELHERVHLYCCNSPNWSLPGKTREERKCAAILDFVAQYPNAVSVGFSDDDPQNYHSVRLLFERLSLSNPQLKWRTYPCGAAASENSPLQNQS